MNLSVSIDENLAALFCWWLMGASKSKHRQSLGTSMGKELSILLETHRAAMLEDIQQFVKSGVLPVEAKTILPEETDNGR
jgi:hypothetical protein